MYSVVKSYTGLLLLMCTMKNYICKDIHEEWIKHKLYVYIYISIATIHNMYMD